MIGVFSNNASGILLDTYFKLQLLVVLSAHYYRYVTECNSRNDLRWHGLPFPFESMFSSFPLWSRLSLSFSFKHIFTFTYIFALYIFKPMHSQHQSIHPIIASMDRFYPNVVWSMKPLLARRSRILCGVAFQEYRIEGLTENRGHCIDAYYEIKFTKYCFFPITEKRKKVLPDS